MWRTKTAPRDLEKEYMHKGFQYICGTDEVGRGCLIGPVVCCALYAPLHVEINGVNDSKKLTEEQREILYEEIVNHPEIVFALSCVDHKRIDEINILNATMQGMCEAVEELNCKKEMNMKLDLVLVDGDKMPPFKNATFKAATLIKGDARSFLIAAASIVAKVHRDRMMDEVHEKWPLYDLKNNKGYGTQKHVQAIREHGPCEMHRTTFQPIKGLLMKKHDEKQKETNEKDKTKGKRKQAGIDLFESKKQKTLS